MPSKKSSKKKSLKTSSTKKNSILARVKPNSKKVRLTKYVKEKKSNKEVIEVSIPGVSNKVQIKNLINIVKREHKKGTKKIISLHGYDAFIHCIYDVEEVMKRIKNNTIKNLLDCYSKCCEKSMFRNKKNFYLFK